MLFANFNWKVTNIPHSFTNTLKLAVEIIERKWCGISCLFADKVKKINIFKKIIFILKYVKICDKIKKAAIYGIQRHNFKK